MTDLTDLAARVEGLSGPCREVFEEAFNLCLPKPAPDCEPQWRPENPKQPIYHAWATRELAFKRYLAAEAWLDAAMTLVPEGWVWTINTFSNGRAGAYCMRSDNLIVRPKEQTLATPALALVAAALRAKEMTDG